MAKIGKITIYVSQSRHGQEVSIRTTGARGQVPLNTITDDVQYNAQSPSDTAVHFWQDVLTKALAAIS
jgi:hypothetical protein